MSDAYENGCEVLGFVNGDWDKSNAYNAGDVVRYWGGYYQATRRIEAPFIPFLQSGEVPGESSAWVQVPASTVIYGEYTPVDSAADLEAHPLAPGEYGPAYEGATIDQLSPADQAALTSQIMPPDTKVNIDRGDSSSNNAGVAQASAPYTAFSPSLGTPTLQMDPSLMATPGADTTADAASVSSFSSTPYTPYKPSLGAQQLQMDPSLMSTTSSTAYTPTSASAAPQTANSTFSSTPYTPYKPSLGAQQLQMDPSLSSLSTAGPQLTQPSFTAPTGSASGGAGAGGLGTPTLQMNPSLAASQGGGGGGGAAAAGGMGGGGIYGGVFSAAGGLVSGASDALTSYYAKNKSQKAQQEADIAAKNAAATAQVKAAQDAREAARLAAIKPSAANQAKLNAANARLAGIKQKTSTFYKAHPDFDPVEIAKKAAAAAAALAALKKKNFLIGAGVFGVAALGLVLYKKKVIKLK